VRVTAAVLLPLLLCGGLGVYLFAPWAYSGHPVYLSNAHTKYEVGLRRTFDVDVSTRPGFASGNGSYVWVIRSGGQVIWSENVSAAQLQSGHLHVHLVMMGGLPPLRNDYDSYVEQRQFAVGVGGLQAGGGQTSNVVTFRESLW
jgi:hypothetical protein